MNTSSMMTEPKGTVDASQMLGGLQDSFLASLRTEFEGNPQARLAQNAVSRTSVSEVALDRTVTTRMDHTFSHVLDEWEVTNQKKSGRCWMFAALNLLRVQPMKRMGLVDFEFSQNYTLFWDKFERANYFLESMIDTADRPVDDRTVAFLLDRPLDDGGQWNMFVNIVKKHGLVPKGAMPETESSSNTRLMNRLVISKLREGAMRLRQLRGQGAPMEAARAAKDEILKVVYRMLAIHLGSPPEAFMWQWNDKDRNFHRDGMMTPQAFAEKYVEFPLDEYVCLVHDPRDSSPVGKTFTVERLGNVVGGDPVLYLNVDIATMKSMASKSIVDGEPVWFGCDVGKMMHRELGLWDRRLFDYDTLYGTSFDMPKKDRLVYHQTLMTHAMLFTGVDMDGERPRRWRVENSWGDESGKKGFFIMNDSWFDEHMFEVATRRSRLPGPLQEALAEPPIVLPAWDPMGALAR